MCTAASRLIKEATESGAIVPYDPDAAPKLMRYVPVWAASEQHPATWWVLDRRLYCNREEMINIILINMLIGILLLDGYLMESSK